MGHALFPAAAQITKDYYHLALSPREIMDQWMDLARDAYLHHVPLKPGALAYLVRCQARGDRMVLFTSCVKELCQAALDRHGLAGYFDHLVFAEDLGAEKRDSTAFPRLLERLEVSAGECTLYEDSPGRVRGGPAGRADGGGSSRPLLRPLRGGTPAHLPPLHTQL